MVTPKKIIIKDLELADKEIARLRKENKELRAENKELRQRIGKLEMDNKIQENHIFFGNHS